MNLVVIFLLFMTYSFLGWLMEVIDVSILNKKLTARGFLIGPYCPIYGVGALLITLFLSKYAQDPLALFIMSCVLGASLEYFTSYIMEKIFKTRWWDYSNHKYNINGRICLNTTTIFGILGFILIHYLNPFFENLLKMIPDILLIILATVLFVIIFTDTIISFNIISNIKKVDLSDVKDTTDEITKKVRETLKSKSFLHKRLLHAFPNLKVKLGKKIENLKLKK